MSGPNALQKFYVFVQSFGGWDRVARKADEAGDKNEIVSKRELNNFLKGKWVDYDVKDFESIWAQVDTVTTGKITKTGVENLGALDGDEAGQVKDRAKEFGELINAIESYFSNHGITSSLLSGLGFNLDDLKYEVAVLLLEAGGDYNDTAIADKVMTAVRRLLKQKCVETFVNHDSRLSNLYLPDGSRYNLAEDETLMGKSGQPGLIDRYLATANDISALSQYKTDVDNIIKAYLHTAGLAYEPTAHVDDQYRYGDEQFSNLMSDGNMTLNDLQKARLYTAYTKALTWDKLRQNTQCDFSSIDENYKQLLDATAKKYIEGQKTLWNSMTQKEFWEKFGGHGGDLDNLWILGEDYPGTIQGRFASSNEYKNLKNLIAIGGIGDEVSDFEGDNWSQFYAQGWYNVVVDGSDPYTNPSDDPRWTENDPKRFAAILYYFGGFGGLDGNGLAKLFEHTNVLNNYLQRAYLEILEHPDQYGISNLRTCSKPAMQNAVMKYFKDHLQEILEECQYTDYEIAVILSNSAMQTANLVKGNDEAQTTGTGTYGSYSPQDIEQHALDFYNYVNSTYGSYAEVAQELEKLKAIIDNHSIQQMKGDQVNVYFKAIIAAIEIATYTPDSPVDPPDIQPKDIYTIPAGREIATTFNLYGSHNDFSKIRADILKHLKDWINTVSTKLIDGGLPAKYVNNAFNSTYSYYEGLINTLTDVTGTGDHNDTHTTETFEYYTYDENGTRTKHTGTTAQYTHYSSEDISTYAHPNTAKSNSSGVYVWERIVWFPNPNEFSISIKQNVVYDKFIDFYDALF